MCQALLEYNPVDFIGNLWLAGKAEVVDLPPADPDPPVTRGTTVSLKPAKKTLRAGRSTMLRLQVENGTDARRKIKVSLKSNNRKVTVKKTVTLSVPAHSALLTKVKVKAGRKARGKAKITATAAGAGKVSSTIKIKKAKARRGKKRR